MNELKDRRFTDIQGSTYQVLRELNSHSKKHLVKIRHTHTLSEHEDCLPELWLLVELCDLPETKPPAFKKGES